MLDKPIQIILYGSLGSFLVGMSHLFTFSCE